MTLLFNECKTVTVGTQAIDIAGLGDYWSGDTRPERALSKDRADGRPVFVLSHNPDSKSELTGYAWDILFSGHTHGGQLVVPFLGWRPFLPVRDKRYPEGLLPFADRLIHITRGIGNLHGLRFNCRPEISLVEVQ